jgi:hypothetical protein
MPPFLHRANMSTTSNPDAHSAYNDAALQRLYDDIRSAGCTDRGAKVQVFCEQVWDRLEHRPLPANSIVQGLVALLQNDTDALLARLVVPDLRPDSLAPRNPVKQQLLHTISPQRPSLEFLYKQPQMRDTEAHRLYDEEKEVLQEAELYRAAMLLYGQGPANEVQKEAIQRWIATYPTEVRQCSCSHSTHLLPEGLVMHMFLQGARKFYDVYVLSCAFKP